MRNSEAKSVPSSNSSLNVNYTPWTKINVLNTPFPRYRHVATSYIDESDNLYVNGGLYESDVYGDTWKLNITQLQDDYGDKSSENLIWDCKFSIIEIMEKSPPPRVGHAATVCGNALIIFGGDTHKINPTTGLMDDDLYFLNLHTNKWTIPNPTNVRPIGRYGHKIAILNSTLYLFGGQFDDTYFNDLVTFDLMTFKNVDSKWDFIKPNNFVPPPLTNFTMCTYDNKLYVFGGDTYQGLTNEVFIYDPEKNEWSILETFGDENINKPPPIQEHAAIIYKNLMCVVGGKDSNGVYLNTVYFLNLINNKWFKLPEFLDSAMDGRSGHTVSLLKNNKLLILGGDKNDWATYNKSGELDLSDKNNGHGIFLHLLDISKLNQLCPGIYNFSNLDIENVSKSTLIDKFDQEQKNLNLFTPIPEQKDKDSSEALHNQFTPKAYTPLQNPMIPSSIENDNLTGNFSIYDHKRALSDLSKKSSPAPNSPIPELMSNKNSFDTNTIDDALSNYQLEENNMPKVVMLSKQFKDNRQSLRESQYSNSSLKNSLARSSSNLDDDIDLDAYFHSRNKSHEVLNNPIVVTKANHNNLTRFDSKDNLIHDLKQELTNLKIITQKRAAEASKHIIELENQISNLKKEQASKTVSDTESEREKIMKDLINSKILDTKELNKIIFKQNEKLEELPKLRASLNLLRIENETIKFENENLKKAINSDICEQELIDHIKSYSNQLESFISSNKASPASATESSIFNTKNTALETPKIQNSSTTSIQPQSAFSKLSDKLDNLLLESKELTTRASLFLDEDNETNFFSGDLEAELSNMRKERDNYKMSFHI